MFIDEVVMEVEAGRGGDGCMAFLREKYVPMGGPNGGNGGKGADIIFKADEGLKTLVDLRYMKNIKGAPGNNGEGKNKNGSYAEDKIIKVPVGTTIKDFDTREKASNYCKALLIEQNTVSPHRYIDDFFNVDNFCSPTNDYYTNGSKFC